MSNKVNFEPVELHLTDRLIIDGIRERLQLDEKFNLDEGQIIHMGLMVLLGIISGSSADEAINIAMKSVTLRKFEPQKLEDWFKKEV